MKSKIVIGLLFVGILLSACSAKGSEPQTTQEAQIAQKTQQDLTRTFSPTVDYFDYVNGEFLQGKEIAGDSYVWNFMDQLKKDSSESTRIILEDLAALEGQHKTGSLEKRISDLYLTALDGSGRDQGGLSGLHHYLDAIQSSATIEEYLSAISEFNRDTGYSSLLTMGSIADLTDPTKYAYGIFSSDLGLGKEILEDEAQTQSWENYKAYVAAVMESIGYGTKEAQQAGEDIFALQKDLAKSALPLGSQWDPTKIYNVYTMEEIDKRWERIHIKEVLQKQELSNMETLLVTQPELLTAVNDYLIPENLELLKTYSSFCLLNDMAAYLGTELRNLNLDYVNRLSGIEERKTDEKLADELANRFFGFELGKLYVEQNFSEKSKTEIENLVQEIINTYGVRIGQLDWMSEETKTAAKKKLQKMTVKIGYPDVWPNNYDNLELRSPKEGGLLIDNVLAVLMCAQEKMREDMAKPVDRTQWAMTPQTVNAYYNPSANEIVFPAGILQAPFYDETAPYAANLGGIGTIIAHEISHAFDNLGAQFDEMGQYNQWWTEADYEKFDEYVNQVVEYYNGYEGFQGIYVNGQQTVTENIADLGALNCAVAVLGEDPEQQRLLFENYARIWASKYTDEAMIRRLNTDVHSPAKVRVNAVVSSTDAFYRAYPELKEGDPMYLSPKDRVKIW